MDTCQLTNAAPVCMHCGALARPNILMFDDWAWNDARNAVQFSQQQLWRQAMKNPVVIEIGAGSAIKTVRNFSERIIQQQGGYLIRINPDECDVPRESDVGLPLGALDALTAIERMTHENLSG
ncbi:hypothetical protein RGU70_16620 [Herbaspirillum sp. RTI4]|uniref:hypothetical protein n=1 Tax=Herbaspirillum sp. RTI4 TaxID=3048640 RepID=UPI002AB551E6|nr:hypothetical protein [Herbaspirillum sp. RTI4]MDY7579938.1 hypothetical protein [Herbaspirillum sp. RTI4]